MSKVSEYVNNMFFTLPQTEEVDRMRWQITESMEDRYGGNLPKLRLPGQWP